MTIADLEEGFNLSFINSCLTKRSDANVDDVFAEYETQEREGDLK
jgi:hypothetical protein